MPFYARRILIRLLPLRGVCPRVAARFTIRARCTTLGRTLLLIRGLPTSLLLAPHPNQVRRPARSLGSKKGRRTLSAAGVNGCGAAACLSRHGENCAAENSPIGVLSLTV